MLSPGLGSVRDVTLAIISHEQIQSNRVCCFQTLDVIFSKCLLSGSFSFRIIFVVQQVSHLMTKPTKWPVRPAKTRISLGICPVWSESSLCAQWVAKDTSFDSEGSDRIAWMPRLIWVFTGRTCHFVGFVMRQFRCVYNSAWFSVVSDLGLHCLP